MATTYSMKGTSHPTFTIGKRGATISQGDQEPTGGKAGDIHLQSGSAPSLWIKRADWEEFGQSASVHTGGVRIDTAAVEGVLTFDVNSKRVLEIFDDASSANGEKLTLQNGVGQLILRSADTGGTNGVDVVLDLQGTGAFKVQSDAPCMIQSTDGQELTVSVGQTSTGAGGSLILNGGRTTAGGENGGDVALIPGQGGAGGGVSGNVTVPLGYLGTTANSVVSRGTATTRMTVEVTASVFTLSDAAQLLLVNNSASESTSIILPNTGNTLGRTLWVKDAKGVAGTYAITVSVASSGTIDGVANHVINTNYGKVGFVWGGSSWLTI